MNHTSSELQIWFSRLDSRAYALLVGGAIGLVGGSIILALLTLGPIITTGLVIGLIAGLYILTDVETALYTIVVVMMLLPFGTLPFSIGFTPSLLDMIIGAFILVYLLQWMKGHRQSIQLTPVHLLIAVYVLWLLIAFALGLRHSAPTPNMLRQFAAALMSISLSFIVVDLLRDARILRRFVIVLLVMVGIQAIIAIILYLLPESTANSILNAFGRLGYPMGNVIRYIEANPNLPERAIGTWIDPNTFGGILAISAAVIAPQLFARQPVLRYRWLTFSVLTLIVLALFLSFSRASALAFAIGMLAIAVIKYHRFLPLLGIGGITLLILPQTRNYLDRFVQAFTAQDLATQMRIGEWTDSLRLISRYPIHGVGFTGSPDIDIYTDVANMYLIMANQIGLVGVAIFLIMIAGVFLYGLHAWRYARNDAKLDSIHLGYHIALLTAMVNAVADLYFFRLDFQPSITLFWLTIALALTSSRLVIEHHKRELTLAKEALVR